MRITKILSLGLVPIFFVNSLSFADTKSGSSGSSPSKVFGISISNRCIDLDFAKLPAKGDKLRKFGPKFRAISNDYSWASYYGEAIDLNFSYEDKSDKIEITDGVTSVDDQREGASKIELSVPIHKIFNRVPSKKKALEQARYEVTNLFRDYKYALENVDRENCKSTLSVECVGHSSLTGDKKYIDGVRKAAHEYLYNSSMKNGDDSGCLKEWREARATKIKVN